MSSCQNGGELMSWSPSVSADLHIIISFWHKIKGISLLVYIFNIFFRYLPGADIVAQTEETQETALTLACCGGFLEVADFLIKAGADIELGCSTPLMEAAQEGHLELVKYLLNLGKTLEYGI